MDRSRLSIVILACFILVGSGFALLAPPQESDSIESSAISSPLANCKTCAYKGTIPQSSTKNVQVLRVQTQDSSCLGDVSSDKVIFQNGLWWAWASPCAKNLSGETPQCSSPVPTQFKGGNASTWRYATTSEWATKPQVNLTNSDFGTVVTVYEPVDGITYYSPQLCAAPWFDPVFIHCDYYDGYGDTVMRNPNDVTIDGTNYGWDSWFVHDPCVVSNNSAPSFSSISVSPPTPTKTSTLSCSVTVLDSEQYYTNVTFEWYKNSANQSALAGTFNIVPNNTQTSISTVASSYLTKNDVWYCRAMAFDGTDYSSWASSSTVTVQNTPPTTLAPTLSPSTAYKTTAQVTCNNGTTSDIDGDAVSFTYLWYKNGASTSITSQSITNASYSKGDSLVCQITPNDGADNGASQNSSAIIVQNSPPTQPAGIVFTAGNYKNDTFTASASGSTDADGDAITYYYQFEANSTGTVLRAYSSLASYSGCLANAACNKNDNVRVKAKAGDGAANSTESSYASRDILNSIPATSIPTLSPTTVYKNTSQVLCNNGTTSDIDGDTATFAYLWYKNGVSTGVASQAITNSSYVKNDVLVCQITPNDGTTNGAAKNSSSLTVLNSPPTGAWVGNFANATAGHWFTVIGSATDADGDQDVVAANASTTLGSCSPISTAAATKTKYGSLPKVMRANSYNAQFNCTSASPGTATVTIGFTDASGAYAQASAPNAYPDAAPVLTKPTLSSPLYSNSTAVCSPGAYSDADGDLENVAARAFNWYKNGTLVPGTSGTLNLSAINAKAGDYLFCRQNSTNSTWPAKVSNVSDTVMVSPPESISVPVYYPAGWNMLSLPVDVSGQIFPANATSSIWPEAASSLFIYDGSYRSVTEAAPGIGYWLKFNNNTAKNYVGAAVSFMNTSLLNRWNIVGSISTPINLSNVRTEPAGILVSDFWGYNNSYYKADILEPGRAYWAKASQAGRLILGTAPANQMQPTSTSGMGYLKVTDGTSKSMSVYFGSSARPELPPKYSGSFDVRYTSDKYAEPLPASGSKTYNVSVSSATYPVKFEWNLKSGYYYVLSYNVSGTRQSRSISGVGSLAISSSSLKDVSLRVTKQTIGGGTVSKAS